VRMCEESQGCVCNVSERKIEASASVRRRTNTGVEEE